MEQREQLPLNLREMPDTSQLLRLAEPLQHRRAPGGAAWSAPSSADSSLVVGDGTVTTINQKSSFYPHITCFAGQCSAAMYSWTLRRPRSMPDACRRLRTLATVQHGSTEIQEALMSAAARTRSSLQPWTHRRQAHMTIRAMWDRSQEKHDAHTSLRTTLSPDVARRHVAVRAQPPQPALRCRLRHTKRRRDLLAAEASRRHALHGETILCVSHHVVVKRLENTWDLEENVACGVWTCHQVGHVRWCAM